MKITGVELDAVHVNHRGDWVFIHVFTDEGIQGLGELRAGKNYTGGVAAVRQLGDQLTGENPLQIEPIFSKYKSSTQTNIYALSAIEQALWDILGKSLNTPIHVLLGGSCREKIRLYANINRATTNRTPEGFAKNALAAVEQGFDAVKLAPFDGLNPGVDSANDAQLGIACMRAVRDAIGPNPDLLVDCHSRFSVKGALEVADALRDLDLFWFEQPVPESNMEGCMIVKEECGLRVAGGEGRSLRQGFTEVFEKNSMHIIMPDVKIIGGIGELKKVADMAAAWGIPTAPHGPSSPVTIAAGVETMLSHSEFLILEYGWGEVSWRNELILPHETICHGYIHSHNQPGLGIELNPEILEAYSIPLP